MEDQLPISDVSTQVNAQFQLQRKQEELQQTIQQHQEELRRISEQLAAVSYGFVNSQADVSYFDFKVLFQIIILYEFISSLQNLIQVE